MEQHPEYGYPGARLAKASETAATHPDPATRERARERVARWTAIVRGMLRGDLVIGSRTPVRGLPVWVTPEVVHGGFATGRPAAAGPLRREEIGYARRHALPRQRTAIFEHAVHPDRLAGFLDARHRPVLPEQSALPILAWLVRAGDHEAAAALLAEIAPLRDRLGFLPEPASGPAPDLELVWREPVGAIRERLRQRAPQPRVSAMNDTLRVWNLYADRVLALWLRTAGDGRVGVHMDAAWKSDARALLKKHARLAAKHPPSRRHAGPKANLTILRTALADVLAGRPWRRGLVRAVTEAMVARRGAPDSPEHRELRARQAADAARPPHHLIAHAVADRMAGLPQEFGTTEAGRLAADVPPSIRAVVRRATAAPIEELITAGLVPSAEVLAGLVPRVAARVVASAYPDPELRDLMAGAYLAFRNRRSLLLFNLRGQVRPDEMPWVRAVAGHRAPGPAGQVGTAEQVAVPAQAGAAEALARLGELTMRAFPGTLIPNPMVRELTVLSREAGLDLPWVEELAADIFEGRFAPKFAAAADLAGALLANTLYDRYYGIDYGTLSWQGDFGAHCVERAGARSAWGSPAQNGMVIEQAQILTTHNLATLWEAGVEFDRDVAERCFAVAERLARRLDGPHALRRVKDIAYAWRQMIFHASMSSRTEDFVLALPVTGPLAPAVHGLRTVVAGGRAEPLTGWSTQRHWLLPVARGADHG